MPPMPTPGLLAPAVLLIAAVALALRAGGSARASARLAEGAAIAALALAAAAKARAYLHGRDYALPEDVADVAPDALAHRIVMTWRAVAEGRTARLLIADVLDQVEAL